MNQTIKQPHLFIVMGVSGTGKSTVAQTIANSLGYMMMEADDFHTSAARYKMSNNQPLDDDDRKPWIDTMLRYLKQQAFAGQSVVLAYSGLRKAHRAQFRSLPFHCHIVYLAGEKGMLSDRLALRESHFFGGELLDSQFDALDVPQFDETDVTIVQINQSVDAVCAQIMLTIDPIIDPE